MPGSQGVGAPGFERVRQLVFMRVVTLCGNVVTSKSTLLLHLSKSDPIVFIKSLVDISCGDASELPMGGNSRCLVSVNTQPTARDKWENTICWLLLQSHSFVFCAAVVVVVVVVVANS